MYVGLFFMMQADLNGANRGERAYQSHPRAGPCTHLSHRSSPRSLQLGQNCPLNTDKERRRKARAITREGVSSRASAAVAPPQRSAHMIACASHTGCNGADQEPKWLGWRWRVVKPIADSLHSILEPRAWLIIFHSECLVFERNEAIHELKSSECPHPALILACSLPHFSLRRLF